MEIWCLIVELPSLKYLPSMNSSLQLTCECCVFPIHLFSERQFYGIYPGLVLSLYILSVCVQGLGISDFKGLHPDLTDKTKHHPGILDLS